MASSDQPNNAVPLNEQNVTDTSNAAHWIALAFVLGFVSLGPSGVLQVKSDLLHMYKLQVIISFCLHMRIVKMYIIF